MADFKKCDGCNKVSPDENGMHIANHWTDFVMQHRIRRNNYTDNSQKVLLCNDCLPVPDNIFREWEWAKSLINFFKRKRVA